MILNDFLLLSEVEQDEEIFECGRFIETYERNHFMYDIYHLYDFYVTISYNLLENDEGKIIASSTMNIPE